MKSVAMITEYNPFHNGHLYHATQSQQEANADVTIAIMSGQFMMRGMPAIFNKFKRAQMATVACDIVVELPLLGSLSSSDIFAEMGIKVASYMQADVLSFGSESGDRIQLKQTAEQLLELEETDAFKREVKSGKSYARIAGEILHTDILAEPNNVLAIAYIKNILRHNPKLQPMTISRAHTHHHDDQFQHDYLASGTAIRKSLCAKDDVWKMMVPKQNIQLMTQPYCDSERLFQLIKLSILQQSSASLKSIYTMSEGFENRLHKVITKVSNYDELMTALKTKRYTYTHIQRILMNLLLNFQYSDVNKQLSGVRILAMSQKGQQYLKHLKSIAPEKQFITNVNRENAPLFKHEIKATEIYNLLTDETINDFNTPVYIAQ
ncbi:nucleotidyltransferase [Staphylococcus coagulans]|uniref:nucleotidyltransferase n=1 Tax=Staphylococcus coagulans TaxID=74706 RepID=UPI0015FBAE53|nr:nucleotidyltransferase [Staphylococcus coagulans]MBA8763666.1 nucleotidyltransferase [Staphylococcus coagulans]MBT2809242.1 nucleotidyltransferase [Staphylococcus coagulans]MBT2811487.1 nucleotidyltransferase [Staphylococcus coagulans]MBT2818215.1 nucleotidyltransferase [Staphylococcus coagulans]MBT2820677.1 nucleotidyltransferase [Staphylococcus coagulans]